MFVYTGVFLENFMLKVHSKYEYFEDENRTFGQSI